ncbi:hypothetical protein [Amycolatopsis decaplanina]|uniref:Uncharacterized protein n=1 Tax=Amycolatopsis decaplanina DSM 44594 TaxID=1284240 RepID=M2Z354_9PSEU|nr:hypothetical protein [Amycolatopsis decaplanina]EME61677.1 hypothetical protein H074_10910 [Amycolatopsis decaplanina DSM 44594]
MTIGDTRQVAGLAIVGDGSALPGTAASDPGAVLAALETDVRLLRDHTALDPFRVAVTARDAAELASALRALPSAVTAIFLARTEPVRARAVQRDLARGGRIPVITEYDTLAIGLAAAVLVTLRRAEVAPHKARVVVAGAGTVPLLVPLLMACGVGDIASWREGDAVGFPLSVISRDASVVVDLLDVAMAPRPAFEADATQVVLTAGDPVGHLLALPGLLRAVREGPIAGQAGDLFEHLDAHRACAQALAGLTPVDRVLPDLADPDLTHRVARAVTEALRPPPRR